MDHQKDGPPVLDEDGIDRRGFLKCMAWAGSGMLYSVHGGVLKALPLSELIAGTGRSKTRVAEASFSFVQISDSHVGFSKDANKDVIGTLQRAVDAINKGPRPDLLLHTGDISHLAKPDEFDAVDQILKTVDTGQRFFVPGEHDVIGDNGALYLDGYGKGTKGGGWYSFDHKGVHFIALVNVLNLKAGGMGSLGADQLAWLADDVRNLSDSTPIVVFAHVPLWTVYPDWGWGTDDSAQALALLKRFGSVTVLNGHIHQTMQKVEGAVTFHTAMSTAFPQPKPGAAPSPGPMKVPADELANYLGTTNVQFVRGSSRLAIVDSTLAMTGAGTDIGIDNFSFSPPSVAIQQGARVKWTNHDDIPHTVVEVAGRFKSPALDTGDSFEHTFPERGTFTYFCSVHPQMTGKVVVH